MLGTPAAADAIDPHNCPRCDHFHMHALAGGTSAFRGVDSPTFTAPSRPTEAELASAPTAWLPWELGFVPELPEVPGLARCEPAADVASKAVA